MLPVQRPAQIINYGSLGTTPMLLGAALAVGAVSALGITLVTSVRRRRRDLAILKTLGFTGRQLATAVSVQAGVAAVIGCIIGIPAGIASGGSLWDLFAGEISAVPDPTVPAGDHRRHRARGHRAGRPGRHHPRPYRCEDGHLTAPPRRIAVGPLVSLSRRTARPAPHRPGAPCPACRSAC